mmetsp:Transcript_35285/g.51844  ORF Transcript_35285/g.51844 Transcript_35285/m.51844 type:complete len:532 (-) Transcript_35285:78-1673(-)
MKFKRAKGLQNIKALSSRMRVCSKIKVVLPLLIPTALIVLACFLHVTVNAESDASELDSLVSSYSFRFESGYASYDAAYNLALSEMNANTKNGYFIAGAGWTQLWTRDTSYAIQLSAGLVNPGVSHKSLLKCTEEDSELGTVWLQDSCGHFGGWPNLSDAIVGVQGAWSLYLVTGDVSFLAWAYKITKSSLIRAERDVYDESSGLFLGCSSFMESNSGYPSKYAFKGKLVGQTKALSTNILYYNGYKLGAMMGQELDYPPSEINQLNTKADRLRDAIRSRLWLPEKGYYSYFEDEDNDLIHQMEGLGESLALLADEFESDKDRVDSILSNTHPSNKDDELGRGIPCLWPRFKIKEKKYDIATFYHNGRIWPFVQGYWAIAAARHDNIAMFGNEFSNLVELSQNQQSTTFAEFYELDGTYLKIRKRQLWSDTGFLGMVYHGLFGMELKRDGIFFKPVKPALLPFADTISLREVVYRKMVLDVFVTGSGSTLESFQLDGKIVEEPFISREITGKHTIEIILSGESNGSEKGIL